MRWFTAIDTKRFKGLVLVMKTITIRADAVFTDCIMTIIKAATIRKS
jgi:hypothetical protein